MEVQAENGAKKSLTYTFSDTCQPTGCTFLECYTIDNQRCTHTASANNLPKYLHIKQVNLTYHKYQTFNYVF